MMKRPSRSKNTNYIRINPAQCEGCWACIDVCPSDVLGRVDFFAHKHVRIKDAAQCKGCGMCIRACPHGAITEIMQEKRSL